MPDQNGWRGYPHFQAAWVVVLAGLVHGIYGLSSGHFRRNLIRARSDWTWRAYHDRIAKYMRGQRADRAEDTNDKALQRTAYVAVISVLFPLIIWTGLAMSPSFTSAFQATAALLDADGTRVAKGTIATMSCDPTANGFQFTENYVLGPGGEELTMLDGSNNWQRTNVFAAGKLLATYDLVGGSPALHFHLEDPLGTRRMQVSGNFATMGQPETDIQSLPFGDALYSFPDQYAPSTADDATPIHFTGKERDTESGLDYFGARYYASSMGRFMSPDWAAKVEPVPYAKLDDPQSLNLYSYVFNNPLRAVDVDGHSEQTDEAEKRYEDWLHNYLQQSHMAQNHHLAQQTYGRQPDGSYRAPTGPGSDIYKRTHGGANEPIGNGQCVTACANFSGVTPDTSKWVSGTHAMQLTDKDIGLAIATFESSGPSDTNGHYPKGHDKNSGIFMGTGYGGIWIVDQWPANAAQNRPSNVAPFLHFIPDYDPNNTRHPSRSDNADAYYVIRVP
jgi:RHS repeat-associated protein